MPDKKKPDYYEMSASFIHFDNLIWQIPAWSTAVFAAVLTAYTYLSEYPEKYQDLKIILLIISFYFFMLTCYVMAKHRVLQAHTEIRNRPPGTSPIILFKLDAQLLMQFFLTMLSSVLVYLILTYYFIDYSKFLALLFTGVLTIVTELYVKIHKKGSTSDID